VERPLGEEGLNDLGDDNPMAELDLKFPFQDFEAPLSGSLRSKYKLLLDR
jgi:hypothetical protein